MLLQYDREELYRKVWEQPMLKVAEEYGVSSVALGKTCRKLNIPVPGRGYWAKVANGHRVESKPALPKMDNVPVIYRSHAIEKRPRPTDPQDTELVAIDQLLASGALTPPDGDLLVKPHPLIRATASRLRSRSRVNEFGILQPREPGGLDIRVSERTLDRALQVMARIVVVLERQGHSVRISDEGDTLAIINSQQVPFLLEEPVQKVVTEKARVPNPTDRWDYDREVTREPVGKLALKVIANTWGQPEQRKHWRDGKTQRLEALVPAIVAGLLRLSISLRRMEEERRKRELDQRRRAEERVQLREAIDKEEEKLDQFNNWVDDWQRAESMRRFIAVYAEKSRSGAAEKQLQCREWVEWANRQADRLDPFVREKPASVLDRKGELSRW